MKGKFLLDKYYLWPSRVLALGRAEGRFDIKFLMDTLTVSLDGPSTLISSDQTQVKGELLWIKPGIPASLQVKDNRVAILSFMAYLPDHGYLIDNYRFTEVSAGISLCRNPGNIISGLKALDHNDLDADSAKHSIDQMLNPRGLEKEPISMDGRIARLIQAMMREEHVLPDAETAARGIGLSRYHFLHLFKHEVKMTFGQFKKICKFKVFNQTFAMGYNITTSAHQANFVDSAHFSRAFHAATGISPSAFYRHGDTRFFMSED